MKRQRKTLVLKSQALPEENFKKSKKRHNKEKNRQFLRSQSRKKKHSLKSLESPLIKEVTEFVKTHKSPLIVILGPTASGKTALSLKIAQEINGEIISTDSRQLYKKMPISTDILTKKKQEGISHHLMAIVEPDQTITLAQYYDLAIEKIQEIYKRKNIPILVGGTGLYTSAIIEGYKIPRIAPDEKLRKKLFQEAENKGNQFLHKKLAKIDPKSAKKIHPNNLRYIVRALEIYYQSKKSKADKKSKSKFSPLLIGINWPRNILYERINERVNNQIKRGLIKEVKKLLMGGHHQNLPSMSTLGIKEVIPYIEGKISLEEAIEILKRNTRRYAKRQMTWFRRYPNVKWITPEQLEKIIKKT